MKMQRKLLITGDYWLSGLQAKCQQYFKEAETSWKCYRFEDPWIKKENCEERGQNYGEKSMCNCSKTAPEN